MAKYETFNPYVFRHIGTASAVLDVGCATGLLGAELRRAGYAGRLIGIEKDPSMARLAFPHYDRVIAADVESIERLDVDVGNFDVIVCADILEHLKYPRTVLEQLKAFLSDEGVFLISVPNVAFVSIRLSLLLGRFSYQKAGGIMDDEHLRFYTRRSLGEMLVDAGLEVIAVRGYNLVRRRFYFLKFLGWLFPTLFCIQFLAEARKRTCP